MRWLIVLLLGLVATRAIATSSDQWMTVVLDGRKIGYVHIQRETHASRIRTIQTLSVRLNRTDRPIVITNTSDTLETLAGRPLAFANTLRMAGEVSHVDANRLPDGRFRVRRRADGQERVSTLAWPTGALLPNGQHDAIRKHGLRPGTHYLLHLFDPSSRQSVRVRMDVLGAENIFLPGGRRVLTHVRQTMAHASSPQVLDLWLDRDDRVLKGAMPLLGFHLEMLACDKACATAPDQGVDILSHAMVDAPRPIQDALLYVPMRYRVHYDDPRQAHLVDTGNQIVQQISRNLWFVDVGRGIGTDGKEAPPTPSDLASTDWLQSDAPLITRLARRAIRHPQSDSRKMSRLQSFVHHYIHAGGNSVGYASALEAARSRSGDCTEYAVLLAALARAEHIPARIVVGLVYARHYAGRSYVFVPHAWVQAWVDGRWTGYDAALAGFDDSHIALDISSGNPWTYFASMNQLHGMHIVSAATLSELTFTPAAASPPAMQGASGGR